jgi:hypothetical protein
MPMARTIAVQRVAEKLCSTSVNSVVTCISGDLDAMCVCASVNCTFDLSPVHVTGDLWQLGTVGYLNVHFGY